MVRPYPRQPVVRQQIPACVACHKAKRRCGRELPACDRCRERRTACTYPAGVVVTHVTKPPTPAAGQIWPAQPNVTGDARLVNGGLSPASSAVAPYGDLGHGFIRVAAPWFLDASSWDIVYRATPPQDGRGGRASFPASGLEFFIDRMRRWADQWASENHCPFIHRRLYGSEDLPPCLQSAQGAWTTYRRSLRGSSNAVLALQIAQSWSRYMVDQQAALDSSTDGNVDLVTQLSRTQALVLFEVLCLFDGDEASRAHGEEMLRTLSSWAASLVQRAKDETCPNPPLHGAALNEPRISRLQSDGTAASSWRAWILSESIRRTWVVAELTEAAYRRIRRDGGEREPPGSIALTVSSGVWDATSPREWIGANGGGRAARVTVHCQRLEELLAGEDSPGVDSLGQALVAYGRGLETVQGRMSS